MRRKILNDHANVFCQMLVGWRMGTDLELFSRLGSGQLSVDVISGIAEFNGRSIERAFIAKELQAWFRNRLAKHQIPGEAIRQARVDAEVVTVVSKPGKRRRRGSTRFSWNCRGVIETDEAHYEGHLTKEYEWVHAG